MNKHFDEQRTTTQAQAAFPLPTFCVSTDLDGTLLDHHTYEWEAAIPAIERLQALSIPIIFNTSKTVEEALELQRRFSQKDILLNDPVVVENGSALYVPKSHTLMAIVNATQTSVTLPVGLSAPKISINTVGEYQGCCEIVFGVSRSVLVEWLHSYRETHGLKLEGYSDWTLQTIMNKTGLSQSDAKMSCAKQFSEPFIWSDTDDALERFIYAAEAQGFRVLKGGRFYHLQGATNKAQPLIWLRALLEAHAEKTLTALDGKKFKAMQFICLGDNHNDVDMLNMADFPVCIKSPVANYPQLNSAQAAYKTVGFGPKGWTEAIFNILDSRI